ncbi:hypothetical protein [Burkholderia anthina]
MFQLQLKGFGTADSGLAREFAATVPGYAATAQKARGDRFADYP